jgi:hypothetical protein
MPMAARHSSAWGEVRGFKLKLTAGRQATPLFLVRRMAGTVRVLWAGSRPALLTTAMLAESTVVGSKLRCINHTSSFEK